MDTSERRELGCLRPPPYYEEYYKLLQESVDATVRELDKTIVALSSSALVLTTTFANNIGNAKPALFVWSWALFLGAVVLTITGWVLSAWYTSRILKT